MSDTEDDETLDDRLERLGVSEYTRERFEAERAELLLVLCAKHGVTETELPTLLREHRYVHSPEDPEDRYIGIMAVAREAGWIGGSAR